MGTTGLMEVIEAAKIDLKVFRPVANLYMLRQLILIDVLNENEPLCNKRIHR